MELFMHKCILWPIILRSQGALHRSPLVHTTSLATHLAAAYHYRISILEAANTVSLTSKILAEDDETMCLDDFHRWKSAETIVWLRQGLHLVPTPSKLILATLCIMDPEAMFVTNQLRNPLGGLYSTQAVEHPTIRHLAYKCCQCPVG